MLLCVQTQFKFKKEILFDMVFVFRSDHSELCIPKITCVDMVMFHMSRFYKKKMFLFPALDLFRKCAESC